MNRSSAPVATLGALLLAGGASADIQLLSNQADLLGEAKGGGTLNPVCIGPLTEASSEPFVNLPSINESTGTAAAKDANGNFAGSGFGLARATVASIIDPIASTLSTSVSAEGRFAAQGTLGMGLGRAESRHVITFTPTANTLYTLSAMFDPVTPGSAPTDVVSLTEDGVPLVYYDGSNPGAVNGVTGTFLAGSVYEICIDLSEFVSGMAGDTPLQGWSIGEISIQFAPGTVILAPPDPCPADVNKDGVASPADFTAWLSCFMNPASAPFCANADLDSSGSIDPADFTAWLAAFNTGCP